MRLVEIKTSEDRLEAQRLKELNKYPALIDLLDRQAQNEQMRQQQTKEKVKRFYILSAIVIGFFILMIGGSVLMRILMAGVQNKAIVKEMSKAQEPGTLIEYKGDDGLYINSADNLKANGGTRLESIRSMLLITAPYKQDCSYELKEIWLIYTPDQDRELRDRIVGVFELTGQDGTKSYAVSLLDNVTYNDDTTLNMDSSIAFSNYYGDGGTGYYSDYRMLKIMEIDHFATDYEITAIQGGDEQ